MARAIRQKELEVMKADLEMADFAMTRSENPNMLAMSAYHYGQAVEKALKAVIHIERPDIYKATDSTGKRLVTTSHRIENLLSKAEICRNGTIAKHRFVAENAESLSEFNNLRYGSAKITKSELKQLSQAAHEIVAELETDFLKANPDVEMNKENLQHEWQSRKGTGLVTPPPDSSKTEQLEKQAAQQQHFSNGRRKNGGKPYKPYRKNGNGSYGKSHGSPKRKSKGERGDD